MKTFAVGGMFLFGLTASVVAQPQSRYGYSNRYDTRFERQARFLGRVQVNLDRAADNAVIPRDRIRILNAKQQVADVQNQFYSGRLISERELNQAIRSVRQVVNVSRLNPQDRDVLRNNLDRMRFIRNSNFVD